MTPEERLLRLGQARGYVTYDEFASALPGDQFTTEVIEDALAALSDHGITLIEAEERTTFEATRHPARHEEPANDR